MGIDGLLTELLDARREIAEKVVERIRAEMPESFEGVPIDDHLAGIEGAIELLVRARLEGSDAELGADPDGLRELGERRARQRVPVDDLLRSWRIGVEEVTAFARSVAPRTDADPEELFDLFQQAFGIADDAMVSVAGGHRLEPGQGEPEKDRRASLVRGALLGRLSADELHSGFMALGLDPLASYQAFRAREPVRGTSTTSTPLSSSTPRARSGPAWPPHWRASWPASAPRHRPAGRCR